MSKKITSDIIEKDYWRNNAQFADLFNAVLFNGKPVIQADSLEEIDTEESSVMENKEYSESVKESRDILKVSKKLVDSGVQFSILGIENQELVHYAMPMRVMLYDAFAYKKQYDSNAQKYGGKGAKQKYGLTSAEYISRMKREDKFAPVITIVIYCGGEEWDGAKRLHEMLKILPELVPFVKDYELNLVEARNNKLIFHNKNNKDFFELAKILLSQKYKTKKIRQKAEEYCKEQKVDGMVIKTVSAALNAKINYKEVKEDLDMCKVFEEIRAEGRIEGRLEATINSIRNIMLKLNKTSEEAMDILGFSEEERNVLRKELEK